MSEPSWRAEARAMTEAVPYARSQRMRRRLRQRAEASATRTRRHWSAIAAFAAGAALVLLSVFVLRPGPPQRASQRPVAATPAPRASATEPSDVSVGLRASGCHGDLAALAQAQRVALEGPCEVTGPGLRIVIADAATLGGDARALVLEAGVAELRVDPHHPRSAPFSVTTPAGRIEVTGTRFTVRHDASGGVLQLHEGHVRLVTAQQVRELVAGERVAWVPEGSRYRLVASTADREPPTPRPRVRRPARRASSRALVETVERLRADGRFAEAAKAIEGALPSLSRRDREVLGFELGKLIERSRGKMDACDHWRAYARDFARGRYADLVAEERARLSCDAAP